MDDNAQRCLTDGSEAISTMLPLRRFVATVFEPDLSVSTQWIPINECLMTWLSQVLISRNIAKDCRSHSDLFTQQWRQTTQWLYDLTFPKSRNNLDSLDVPSLHPRVSQLSCYCRLRVGPWHIYMLLILSLSALPVSLSRGGHVRWYCYL